MFLKFTFASFSTRFLFLVRAFERKQIKQIIWIQKIMQIILKNVQDNENFSILTVSK